MTNDLLRFEIILRINIILVFNFNLKLKSLPSHILI